MKNSKVVAPLVFLLIVSLFSCSVQKRRYTKGYQVTWKKTTPSTHAMASAAPVKPAEALPPVTLATAVPPGKPADEASIQTPGPAPAPKVATREKSAPVKPLKRKNSSSAIDLDDQLVLSEIDPGVAPERGAASVPITNYGNGNFGNVFLAVLASVIGLFLSFLLIFLFIALFEAGLEFLIVVLLAAFLVALVVVGITMLINSD